MDVETYVLLTDTTVMRIRIKDLALQVLLTYFLVSSE